MINLTKFKRVARRRDCDIASVDYEHRMLLLAKFSEECSDGCSKDDIQLYNAAHDYVFKNSLFLSS